MTTADNPDNNQKTKPRNRSASKGSVVKLESPEHLTTVSPSHSLNSDCLSENSDSEEGSDDKQQEGEDGRSCMKLKLKLGVSPLNVVSLLLGSFAATIQIVLTSGFTSYLLQDHFDLEDAEAAEMVGDVGFVGEIASACTELVIGTLMDMYGRKFISVAGLLFSGVSTLVTPLPTRLIGIYCLRCTVNIGVIALVWSPFGVDYIHGASLGLFSGYNTILKQTAGTLASSGAIQIERGIGVDYVYYIYGGLVVLIGIFLTFGLKDVVKSDLKTD